MTTMVILALSNLMISMLRKMIPDSVRMPAYIVVVASFVTIVQFLLQGFIPSLYDSLGIYIPLIVVNCIILGRAEAYASKNGPVSSLFDGIGMGLGFTVGLTSIGIVRELIGSGKIFGMTVFNGGATIFILAPGAFFVLAMLVALQNRVKMKKILPQLRRHATRASVRAAPIICVQVRRTLRKEEPSHERIVNDCRRFGIGE